VCVLWDCLFGRGQLQRLGADFVLKQNQQEAPSPNEIRRCVRQWCEEGSVTCKKPPGRPSSIRTLDNIARETLQDVMRSFLSRVHVCIWGGWWPLKRNCTQNVKVCKKKVKHHSKL